MNIGKAELHQKYQQLKSSVREHEAQPQGRVEIKDSLSLDGKVVVKAGSSFDDDPATRDTLKVSSRNDKGAQVEESFEEFQETSGWWIFSRTHTHLTYNYSESGLGGFSNFSVTYQLD